MFSDPPHPARVLITRPSNVGISKFLTNLNLNINNENDEIYIYSPSLHQHLYQKLLKCFSNYIRYHIIPNFLNEEDIAKVNDEIVKNKDFEKSHTEIETLDKIDEIEIPQEHDGGIIILDDLNGKEKNDPRVQAMFKRTRHIISSFLIFSQDYCELPKKTIRANGNIYHTFKPNKFRDDQNLYQDKASMDMNIKEFKLLTSTCWKENYQPFTIDTTKRRYQGRYRLGLNSIFVPNSSPF